MKIRGMDNFRFVLIIFGITVLSIANSCLADMIDQSFESGSTDGTLGQPDNAQTFTVGLAGILSQIHVEVERHLNLGFDLVMDVRNTIGGEPIEDDGAVLATTTISASSFPVLNTRTWIKWDVASSGISVDVGDVLAIVLRVPDATTSANYFWLSSSSGSYAGGQRWTRSLTWNESALGIGWNGTYAENETSDMNFRTFVVPAPGAVLLGSIGLAYSSLRLRKRKEL